LSNFANGACATVNYWVIQIVDKSVQVIFACGVNCVLLTDRTKSCFWFSFVGTE